MSKNRSEMTYDELVEDTVWMEKIRQEYYEDIKSWDWQEIVDRAKNTVEYNPLSKRWEGIAYLGSCFTIMPSGKYLHFLSPGDNAEEFLRDEIFMEVLEEVAEEYDGYVFNGDDPTDLYFGLDNGLKPKKVNSIVLFAYADSGNWYVLFWRGVTCNDKKLSELSNATKLRIKRVLEKHFHQLPAVVQFPSVLWIPYIRKTITSEGITDAN